jgi:carbon storage regulator
MLVLSRRCGQRIVVSENIVVTVVSTRGSRVRIGIEAPAEVGIARQEVWMPSDEPGSGIRGNNHDQLDL